MLEMKHSRERRTAFFQFQEVTGSALDRELIDCELRINEGSVFLTENLTSKQTHEFKKLHGQTKQKYRN